MALYEEKYWVAMDRDKAVGVMVQSYQTFPAILSPMEPRVVAAMVYAIAEAGISLPEVNADAAIAASFAGQWTERCKSAATPFQGQPCPIDFVLVAKKVRSLSGLPC